MTRPGLVRRILMNVPLLAAVPVVLAADAGDDRRDDPPPIINPDSTVPCGPTAAAVAAALLGIQIDNRRLAMLSDDQGFTSLSELRSLFASTPVHTVVARLTPKQLIEFQGIAILHLRVPHPDGPEREHFCVFAGTVLDNDDIAIVIDAIGVVEFRGPHPMDKLAEKWDGWCLLLSHTPIAVEWSHTAHVPSQNATFLWLLAISGVASGILGVTYGQQEKLDGGAHA